MILVLDIFVLSSSVQGYAEALPVVNIAVCNLSHMRSQEFFFIYFLWKRRLSV